MDFTSETIGGMLDYAASQYASNVALSYQHRVVTYAELQSKVNLLARGLIDLGVLPGDRVAIWMPNYPEWVYSCLAIAKIGALNVPVNIRFRAPEVEYLLKQSGATTIIMDDAFLTNDFSEILHTMCPEVDSCLPGELASSEFPSLRNIVCLRDHPGMFTLEEVMNRGARPELEPELASRQAQVKPTDPVNVFYTSGTTGRAKGAMADHRVLANIRNYNTLINMSADDVVLVSSPLFYATANYWAMLAPLMSGAQICLCVYFTPEEKLELISSRKVTVVVGMAKTWIDLARLIEREGAKVDSLRFGWTAGAFISLAEIKYIQRRLAVPDFRNVYGMTETGGITTMTRKGDAEEVLAATIGPQLDGHELKIVDPESGIAVEEGQPGELCVRGPYVIQGYLNMSEEETALYFDEEGWFRTGDIVSCDEYGYYSFVGRAKDIIKVGGENVSLNEVDECIKRIDGVLVAVNVGIPDEDKLEVPVAFVEVAEGVTLSGEDVIQFCRKNMASFKVPKHVMFISEWPVTSTGKIQRFRLREKVPQEWLNASSAGVSTG